MVASLAHTPAPFAHRTRVKTPADTPIPVSPGAAPVVLYGGAFDPPHIAHTVLPGLVRERMAPGGWLVFVPAARSPLKRASGTPDPHRLAMLRLAIRELPKAAVWTDELDRARPGEASYWVDTLERARAQLPAVDLRFVIGADQALDFHRWREPRRILTLARPAVMLRAPAESAESLREGLLRAAYWSEDEVRAWLDAVVTVPLMAVSATEIRAKLASGTKDLPELDPAVLGYIREHHLYGA